MSTHSLYKKEFGTPLLSQKTDINDISDNRVRYISMGIVNVTEPLKICQDKNSHFVIFDTHEQNLIIFDIRSLYDKFIKFGIQHVETNFGNYKLSQKTIDDISRLIENN